VRCADDFRVCAKRKIEAERIGNSNCLILRDIIKLPINKAKSGICSQVNFQLLGPGFVPIYKKGIKGWYQL
jgi:RNA-directed DNA polymerase